jgi:hypothetical protein
MAWLYLLCMLPRTSIQHRQQLLSLATCITVPCRLLLCSSSAVAGVVLTHLPCVVAHCRPAGFVFDMFFPPNYPNVPPKVGCMLVTVAPGNVTQCCTI